MYKNAYTKYFCMQDTQFSGTTLKVDEHPARISSTFKLVSESCVSYMLRPAEKPPLHFCMQFTKAINSAILMFSYTLRWNVSCLPCVTVPGGRGPTLPKAGGPRLLKELYFTWMMKAYLLPQSSSGTTIQVTFAGTVNS